jgi:hypothetical protein
MGFAADWLALREPADLAARDQGLLRLAASHAGAAPVILDLGCGTGATTRAMTSYLPSDAEWRLLDGDGQLLEQAKSRVGKCGTIIEQDLSDVSALPLEDVTLVTASALLDLVSATWVSELAARLSVPFYAALSYNGEMRWSPEDKRDAQVTTYFNTHQQSDKGLGQALGPQAGSRTVEILRGAGFEVHMAQSPWRLGPDMKDLHAELTDGIAAAAQDAGCKDADEWGTYRRTCAEHCQCEIGHVDLFAIPVARQ